MICEYWWKYYVLLCSTNLRKLTDNSRTWEGTTVRCGQRLQHSSSHNKAIRARMVTTIRGGLAGRSARGAPETRHSVMHIFANKKLYTVSSNYYMIFLNKGCGFLSNVRGHWPPPIGFCGSLRPRIAFCDLRNECCSLWPQRT